MEARGTYAATARQFALYNRFACDRAALDVVSELVAVVANPTYRSTAVTRAFDRQEGLTAVPNWLYLTGSLSDLAAVWRHYGVTVQNLPAGAMSAHNDLALIIDPAGRIRQELSADPGPGTSGTKSSFSVLLSQYVRQALGPAGLEAAPGMRPVGAARLAEAIARIGDGDWEPR